ncbi:TadE/TadG family type IV pilus assembly protein [Raineyella sp. LH-20]|uniref:TadE/TadG family type IV pilus assembly protein n=1 Tax=Raineyella sp. LH-20 TaxID=3081204 RepID=UPI002953FB16|nr:TadE/TadG family type IV pilus assembly protein [Raineyella sp. LH-20]WOP17746.1 TadE/TadG family type IV pilus assembly protein [Raineyella sp. LH-20]
MVEFALLLPVLMALVLGIIEFGFALFAQASLAGAAREAAREMAIHNDAAQARTAAVNAAAPAVTLPAGEVGITADCPSAAGQVVVAIDHPYVGLTGWLPAGIVLHGRGVMRCGG